MEKILFHLEDTEKFRIEKGKLRKYIQEIIKCEKKQTGEISIVFCSDKYLLQMNKEHLGHDYFTDIITFDYVNKNIISGDLFISVDRVIENAEKFKVEFDIEIKRVIFHGVLHLVGYDDKDDRKREEIREKENCYLRKFKIV